MPNIDEGGMDHFDDGSDIFNDAKGGCLDPSLDESIRDSIRCSFISSDSGSSAATEDPNPHPERDTFVMSRLNWITSLKLVFDQLESFNSQK